MFLRLSYKSIIQAVNLRERLTDSVLNGPLLTYLVLKNLAIFRSFLPRTCFMLALVFSFSSAYKVYGQEQNFPKISQQESKVLPSHLSEKFYRQALYFYFQNKPEEALVQMNINQDYFLKTPVHASLFRAGLQISQGLHQDAQVLLAQLSVSTESETTEDDFLKQSSNKDSDHDITESNLKKEALKVIVFLQLAEQKIAEQNFAVAQNILANITAIPEQYLGQYYVMQQLIAWPKQPDIENFNLNEASKNQLKTLLIDSNVRFDQQDNSIAYIMLNEALSAMNQQQFVLAEDKLKRLQLFTWQAKTGSFWQKLFADKTNNDKTNNDKTLTDLKQIEQNGIKHYAQLLLAQLYIEQGLFQQGYEQLESFPKSTPFTEHALFLYGYSAFMLQQYNVSEVILSTLIAQYPYANFSQQAWLLSAEQYTAQKQLNNALNRYLEIEEYYQTKQQELSAFANTLAEQKNLLPFYQLLSESKAGGRNNNNVLWQKLSLRQSDNATLYQQLKSVEQLTKQLQAQQNKSRWLANTIELNTARQNNIRVKQKNTNHPKLLKQLADKRSQLVALLDKAESLGNGELFANPTEQKLLARIENSKNALALIEDHKQGNRSTVEYQQRLSRVQGVLAWQLQQAFANRYWQTRQSLNVFERAYDKTLQQHEKVTRLLSQQGSLYEITNRREVLNHKITVLLTKTNKIKGQINTEFLNGITQFIETENIKIEQFLLFNQRAMAGVIEKLNQQEAFQ
jgi:hypothetical protein